MSDLCGCGNTRNNSCGLFGNNSCIWIILLLLFCGGDNNGCGCGGSIFGSNGNNGCCDWIIWIILISCLCGGNGNTFGNGCGNCC